MKKVILVRLHDSDSSTSGNYDITSRLLPESELMEVSDEEYDMLCDHRVRSKIMSERYGHYYDRLILIESKTQEIPELIKSASEVLEKIKKAEANKKIKEAAEQAKKKKTLAAKQIEKAKKILKDAGEL